MMIIACVFNVSTAITKENDIKIDNQPISSQYCVLTGAGEQPYKGSNI